MHIGLLVCGDLPERYSAIAGDFPEWIETLLRDDGLAQVVFDVTAGDLPDDSSGCDAYIISGSASSVYEDEAWISDLKEFVRRAADRRVPVFGICFGHQILAEALGGSVERAENGWGIGVHTMRVVQRRSWMDPQVESVDLAMSHQDQVVELPETAVVLGSSDHCENYLVEYTPTVVGIQGHPEFPASFAQALYEDKRGELGEVVDDAIASISTPTDAALIAQWMKRLFADG